MKKKITFKFCSTPHFTFGTDLWIFSCHRQLLSFWFNIALFNRRIYSFSFSSRRFTNIVISLSHSRNTWSKTISQIASYHGPCLAGYGEGVRRLAELLWSVEKRPTSPRPNAKDFVSPTTAKLIPLSFARIVRSESSSRFHWGEDCSNLK